MIGKNSVNCMTSYFLILGAADKGPVLQALRSIERLDNGSQVLQS
jgi:hypothetical protein